MVWLIVGLIWLGFAFTSAFVASEKGRDAGAWFGLGLLFGFFAFFAVAAVPATWEKPEGEKPDAEEGIELIEDKRPHETEADVNVTQAQGDSGGSSVFGITIMLLIVTIGIIGLMIVAPPPW